MKPRRKYLVIERSRHGRPRYYFRKGSGERVRLPDDYGSKDFWVAYRSAFAGAPVIVKRMRMTADARVKNRISRTVETAIRRAQIRAKLGGIAFDLTYEWAIGQIERQKFRCALSGVPFFAKYDGKSRVHPFCPSLDRIEPGQGYTQDNVRIVAFAVNVMLMDWGVGVLEAVANHYRARKANKI